MADVPVTWTVRISGDETLWNTLKQFTQSEAMAGFREDDLNGWLMVQESGKQGSRVTYLRIAAITAFWKSEEQKGSRGSGATFLG